MRVLVLLLLLGTPALAVADAKSDARKRMEKGMALHAQGKLREALGELTVAYTLDPDPDTLYAIAQIHMQLGECEQATTFYQRFLGTRPNEVAAAAAHEAIEGCHAAAPPASPPPVTTSDPEPAPAPAPAVTVEPEPVDSPQRWYADPLALGAIGGGLVLSVVGVVTYRSALDDLDTAESAPTYRDYDQRIESAQSKRTFAIVFAVAGAGATGFGVYRLVQRRRETRVMITPTAGGGMVSVRGSF